MSNDSENGDPARYVPGGFEAREKEERDLAKLVPTLTRIQSEELEKMRYASDLLLSRPLGDAIRWLREGKRVERLGWNGKYLRLVPADGARAPFVELVTANGSSVPWVCSQTDLLAIDWREVIR